MDRAPRFRSRPHDLRREHPASPAETTQRPDPEAWSLARLYANGDTRRLVVLDDRTVLVRNCPAGA